MIFNLQDKPFFFLSSEKTAKKNHIKRIKANIMLLIVITYTIKSLCSIPLKTIHRQNFVSVEVHIKEIPYSLVDIIVLTHLL